MHFSRTGRLLLTVLLLTVCVRLASGQRYLGGIQGEVTDTTGAKVVAALERAVRRGVTCRVLVDYLGSRRWARSFPREHKEVSKCPVEKKR